MEGLADLLIGAIRWLTSVIGKGKLRKWMIVVILLPTFFAPIAVWLYSLNSNQGGDVKWAKAICTTFGSDDKEKAEALLYATPNYVQFRTSQGRIIEFQIYKSIGTGSECKKISNAILTPYKPIKDCNNIVKFKIVPPPEKVVDTLSAEECDYSKYHTKAYIHTEYAILEDGSLWYWREVAHSKDSDVALFSFICVTPIAFLFGIGIVWLYFNWKNLFIDEIRR